MNFPDKDKLKKMRDKLSQAEGTYIIPPDAPLSDRVKFELCQRFIQYVLKEKITQTELAERLSIPQPRVNEILKCKIQNFTIDRLLNYYAILFPGTSVNVKAS